MYTLSIVHTADASHILFKGFLPRICVSAEARLDSPLVNDGGFWTADAPGRTGCGDLGVEASVKGVRAIAGELGMSHITVRRYLKDARAVRYAARKARPRKLDPFHEYLRGRVDAARPHWIPATVLRREVRASG